MGAGPIGVGWGPPRSARRGAGRRAPPLFEEDEDDDEELEEEELEDEPALAPSPESDFEPEPELPELESFFDPDSPPEPLSTGFLAPLRA